MAFCFVLSLIHRVHPKQELTLGKAQKVVQYLYGNIIILLMLQKTFAPTIPTSRRVKRETSESAEKPIKKESVPYNDEKKGRKKGKKDVIKSESVFSLGPAGKSMQERESKGSICLAMLKPTLHFHNFSLFRIFHFWW